MALATVEGQTCSLPFDSGASGLFYRSDLLAEAGYKAEDLADITRDQMIEIGKAVQAKTGKPMFSTDQNDAGAILIGLGRRCRFLPEDSGGAGCLCQLSAGAGG